MAEDKTSLQVETLAETNVVERQIDEGAAVPNEALKPGNAALRSDGQEIEPSEATEIEGEDEEAKTERKMRERRERAAEEAKRKEEELVKQQNEELKKRVAELRAKAEIDNAIQQAKKDAAEAKEMLKNIVAADAKVRSNAICAFGHLGEHSKPAIPYLTRVLLKDPHLGCRGNAAISLALLGKIAKPALPALTKVAKDDPVEWVRTKASTALESVTAASKRID